MEHDETSRNHRQQDDGRWQWSESRKLPGEPKPATGTYRTGELLVIAAAPGDEGEPFDDAASRSISFQPPDGRPERGEQDQLRGCGKSRSNGRRWFNMYVTTFSDGSSETRTYYYDTVGTSK